MPDPTPLRLEYRSPAELADNPRNWRRHPDAQLAALSDVIGEVGWAGACLYNERTGRLIDGHARRKVALTQGADRIPVLVGEWDEAAEAKILATLDPLGAMATADAAALDALLRDVQTGSQAVGHMLEEIATAAGVIPNIGAADLPDLPTGDRQPFQQMTFTVHDDQAYTIKDALAKAKGDGGDTSDVNENSNGNALARIAEAYLAGR
jgi:hypothetical protein